MPTVHPIVTENNVQPNDKFLSTDGKLFVQSCEIQY